MATTPDESEEVVPTRAEQLASIFGTAKTAIAGSTTIPLRVTVLFVVAVFSVFMGQYWWLSDPIAIACLLLLAISWPGQRR
jgi:hypothetical protein